MEKLEEIKKEFTITASNLGKLEYDFLVQKGQLVEKMNKLSQDYAELKKEEGTDVAPN